MDSNLVFAIFRVREILLTIFTFLPQQHSKWFALKLVGKEFCRIVDAIYPPNVDNDRPIRWSCRYGKDICVKKLISDDRVDITVEQNYPFRIACRNGHENVFR